MDLAISCGLSNYSLQSGNKYAYLTGSCKKILSLTKPWQKASIKSNWLIGHLCFTASATNILNVHAKTQGDQRLSVAHCYGCCYLINHYALYELNLGNRSEAHPHHLYLFHDPCISCNHLLQKQTITGERVSPNTPRKEADEKA